MLDAAFITEDYTNWKDATRKKVGFSQHETWPVSPGSCRENLSITLHATTKDVGEHIASADDEDKANNRKCLMKLSSNICFLAR